MIHFFSSLFVYLLLDALFYIIYFIYTTYLFFNMKSTNWFQCSIKSNTNQIQNRREKNKFVARELFKTTCASVDTQPRTACETEMKIVLSLYFIFLHTAHTTYIANKHVRIHTHATTRIQWQININRLKYIDSYYEIKHNEHSQFIPMDTIRMQAR